MGNRPSENCAITFMEKKSVTISIPLPNKIVMNFRHTDLVAAPTTAEMSTIS